MNLEQHIRKVLREETSQESKLKDSISKRGFYKTSKMFGGIENLYKILGFTGTQDEMIFIVNQIMKHDVPVIKNICDYRIEPTEHSLKLYVEIPIYYPNLGRDSWGNRSEVNDSKEKIETLIHKLGNTLVRGHNIKVSMGECQYEEL